MAMECFFTKSAEGKRKVKELMEDYVDVEVETFSINTKRKGAIAVSIVSYDKEKSDGLFSEAEWETICKSRGIVV